MKNLTLCPLSFLSPPRSLVSRDEIFFALFHFAKISISFPRSGKKITSILLFVRKIFNIKEKKIKILEIRKIINRASSLFQIKAIRYIPRLFSPFFYNRNNTPRREENKRKKKVFRSLLCYRSVISKAFSLRSCCAQQGISTVY